MHTITLKADNCFFKTITSMVGEYKITKSDLIRKAVIHYNNVLQKEKLRKQMQKASFALRGKNEHFDHLSNENLNNV